MKPICLVTAPVATRSGYGAHSRDICRSLIKLDKYDVRICDAISRDDDFVNYYMTLSRIQILSQFIKSANGLSLLKALKRINNILDPSLSKNTFGLGSF